MVLSVAANRLLERERPSLAHAQAEAVQARLEPAGAQERQVGPAEEVSALPLKARQDEVLRAAPGPAAERHWGRQCQTRGWEPLP